MVRDFTINACILIALLFVGNQLFARAPLAKLSGWWRKAAYGMGYGIVGIVLMHLSMHEDSVALFGARYVAIILIAMYEGVAASSITAVVISVGYLLYFGMSLSSEVAVADALTAGIACGFLGRIDESLWRKWTYMNALVLVLGAVSLACLPISSRPPQDAIPYHWMTLLATGFVGNYVVSFLRQSNLLYNQLETDSRIDFLTGLSNVRQFDAVLNAAAIRAHQVPSSQLALILVDIDHFKQINDRYGHLAGDRVLKQLGVILTSIAPIGSTVARNGGEEFSMLIPDLSHNQVVAIAEAIRKSVEHHPFSTANRTPIHVTVSVGVSTYPDTTLDVERLVQQADDGLYHAKRSGRNQVGSVVAVL